MKLKLKEDPSEWRKFMFVFLVFLTGIGYLLYRRYHLDPIWFSILLWNLGLWMIVASIFPRWFRGVYRAAMTGSFYMGQVMGHVLLTAFYLLFVTPLGLGLRLMGKDLLALKKTALLPPIGSLLETTRSLITCFKRLIFVA